MKGLKSSTIKFSSTVFLILTSAVFILFRIPSLFEPYWYVDEGIYEVVGFALRHGRLLYRDIWDNKPPLLYLIYALFDGNQLYVKLMSLLFGVAGLILLYFLAKKLQMTTRGAMIATALFALLFGTPLFEGNIANAENFMIPIIIGAYIVFLYALKQKKWKSLLFCIAGLLLGLAFLIKVVAIFDTVALVCFFFFTQDTSLPKLIKQLPQLLLFGIFFCLPLAGTFLFFASQHALKDFIFSGLLYNISYVELHNTFFVPFGFLCVKCLFLVGACFILWVIRKKIDPSLLFVSLWLAFSVFSALFSEYNFTHYMLVIVASLSLYTGILFTAKEHRIYILLGFGIVTYLISNSFYVLGIQSIRYYTNFYLFITRQESQATYQSVFGEQTSIDYAVTAYLQRMSKPTDSVMVWGYNPQLYRLLGKLPPGRFMVAFHIELVNGALQETKNVLEKQHPIFIVVMPNQENPPLSLSSYKVIKNIDHALIYKNMY